MKTKNITEFSKFKIAFQSSILGGSDVIDPTKENGGDDDDAN